MCNEDDGLAAVRPLVKPVQQFLFGLVVQGTGSLVQEQDAAVAQQGSCYADALRLSLAQAGSQFTAGGIQSAFDGKFGAGSLKGFQHLLFGGRGVAE